MTRYPASSNGGTCFYLAATHREADERNVAQVELDDDGMEVLRKGVVVVAEAGLGRLAKPPAIVGNDAIPGLQQRGNMLLPRRHPSRSRRAQCRAGRA